jgi:hypothetical protein
MGPSEVRTDSRAGVAPVPAPRLTGLQPDQPSPCTRLSRVFSTQPDQLGAITAQNRPGTSALPGMQEMLWGWRFVSRQRLNDRCAVRFTTRSRVSSINRHDGRSCRWSVCESIMDRVKLRRTITATRRELRKNRMAPATLAGVIFGGKRPEDFSYTYDKLIRVPVRGARTRGFWHSVA